MTCPIDGCSEPVSKVSDQDAIVCPRHGRITGPELMKFAKE